MSPTPRAVRSVVEALETRRLLAAGDLDLTFGTGGKYIDPHELVPTDLAVQADGKILISGYGLFDVGSVLRLNANGTPDASFGSNGYATSGFGPYTSIARAVAAGPGGRVAVAGFAGPYTNEIPNQATLVVYNSAGQLDRSFDADGILNAPQFPRGFSDVAFQPDGKILALGEKLVRYNANGTLDTSFDNDGIVDVSGKKIALDSTGRIAILGYFAVFRFGASGAKDITLDGDGVLPNVKGADLAIAPGGDILIAASGPYGDSVSRFTSAGAPKPGWGGGGVLRAPGNTLAVTADTVYVGNTAPDLVIPHDQFQVTALTNAGQYDTTFGSGGQQKIDFGWDNDDIVGIALQNGKLVAVGSTEVAVANPPGHLVLQPAVARLALSSAPPTGQSPFGAAPISIPGIIQAEDFDRGGEGVAYHDTDSANLGAFAHRPGDGVDVQTVAAGPYVGFVKAGEWLEYTINLTAAGAYDLAVFSAHLRGGGQFHLELDGQRLGPNLTTPNTGDWTTFTAVHQRGVNLPAGQHVLRLAFDTNGALGYVGNFDRITVSPVTPAQTPRFGLPFKPGDRIQAEDYDNGGEGVAFHDLEPQNLGTAPHRPGDGVDIQPTTDAGGGFNVGFLRPGEWLEYSIDVAETADYDFDFRYASLRQGGFFRLVIDGNLLAGPAFRADDTAAWQTYRDLRAEDVPLTAGRHVVHLHMESPGDLGYVMNLNWFTFAKA